MKSIHTKITTTLLFSVLVTAILIGGISVLKVINIVNNDSKEITELICENNSLEIDATFASIEQSVDTLATYAKKQITDLQRLKTDDEYLNEYTESIEELFVNSANNTDGAIGVYIRYNTDFASPTSGIFWTQKEKNIGFIEQDPTNISLYKPTDDEHVAWYYQPLQNKKSTWIEPYVNKNINMTMISYVIPMYVDGEFFGIVGMDIDYKVIRNKIRNMKVYKTGYAFLINDDEEIMYHPKYDNTDYLIGSSGNIDEADKDDFFVGKDSGSYDSKDTGKDMFFVSTELKNGMTLILTAPENEINSEQNGLIVTVLIISAIISVVIMLISIPFTNRIVHPLRELKEAAQQIAQGEYNISLKRKSDDELGELTDSFIKTTEALKKYHSYINELAYIDALTGIKNNTSFQTFANNLDKSIKEGNAEFAIVVFDVNDLKIVNDTYGHDAGDDLLKDTSRLICVSFAHSPVFRIGGDEFVAILKNEDYKNRNKLIEEFDIKTNTPVDKEFYKYIHIAYGCAVFDSKIDNNVDNVFKRADKEMYKKKRTMKNK